MNTPGEACGHCEECVDLAVGAHSIQCLACGEHTLTDGTVVPKGERPAVRAN